MPEEYFRLLRAHQGYLERVAQALLGNRADAEDALQEAALSGFMHFDQLRGGEAAFRAWMRRILVHECGRMLRARQRVVPMASAAEAAAAAAPGPDAEAGLVWELVADLADHLRPVVVMRYLLDLPQQEIADLLAIPIGTVKSRLGKALAQLRQAGRAAGLERWEA